MGNAGSSSTLPLDHAYPRLKKLTPIGAFEYARGSNCWACTLLMAPACSASVVAFKECDLMFLWGARDFVFDLTFLNEFRQRFPQAQTHVFHDAGHYLFEDKAKETTDKIKAFLNK